MKLMVKATFSINERITNCNLQLEWVKFYKNKRIRTVQTFDLEEENILTNGVNEMINKNNNLSG